MKAAFIVAPRKFEIRDIEVPTINENEMLVRIGACGVCMSDTPAYLDTWSEARKKERPFPRRVGHEPSGTVVEVGKNVQDYKKGDRITGVFGIGCFAEYVKCTPSLGLIPGSRTVIAKIPDEVAMEYAMGEPLMDSVSHAEVASPILGDYVFQVGCGFMGLTALAGIAQMKGLKEYIACDLEDSRLQLAKELGATVVLNSRKVDVVKEVMNMTGGRGVDVAIEAVGHPIGLHLVGAVIKRGKGKIVSIGWHQAPDTYDLYDWIKSPIIYSPQGTAMSPHPEECLPRAIWAVKKGIYPMEKLVTHKYKLEEIDRAFQDATGRTPGYIKGVVMP